MLVFFYNEFAFLLPQLFVIVFFLLGLLVFSAYSSFRRSSGVALGIQAGYFFVLGILLFTVLLLPYVYVPLTTSFSSLLFSSFVSAYVLLILVSTCVVVVLYNVSVAHFDLDTFEVPFFIVVVAVSTAVVASASDFLVLYLGLELQALSLYVLATSRVNSTFSTEAGLKYFVMGSFASCLLLFGISIVYGLSGLVNFNEINAFLLLSLSYHNVEFSGFLLAFLFIAIGLLFKVGAVPFHSWVPDVYTGVPLVISMFFSVVPKIAAWVLLVRLSASCFLVYISFFSSFFAIVGVVSLLVGVFGGVYQTSLKRLLAYSAISHTGYLLLGLSVFHFDGFVANFVYLFTYVLSLLPVFLVFGFYSSRNSKMPVDSLYGLSSIYKQSPILGLVLVASFFSLAGVPPFSGFFTKLYVFYLLINHASYTVGAIALFLSAASAVYYLKLIRFNLFFKDNLNRFLLLEMPRSVAYCTIVLFFLNVSFFAWGADLLLTINFYYLKMVAQ